MSVLVIGAKATVPDLLIESSALCALWHHAPKQNNGRDEDGILRLV